MSVVSELVADYTMPEVRRGKVVEYFKFGSLNPVPETATVETVVADQISVRTRHGIFYDSVRHKDDPRLELNPEWKKAGTWDFSPEDKLQRGETAALKARVAQLESRIKALEGKQK